MYLPLDTAIADFLGASVSRKLHIWLMNERLAKNSYLNENRKQFFYYRSTGKRIIHWVEESIDKPTKSFQLLDHERILKTDAELTLAFLNKNPLAKGTVFAPHS